MSLADKRAGVVLSGAAPEQFGRSIALIKTSHVRRGIQAPHKQTFEIGICGHPDLYVPSVSLHTKRERGQCRQQT